MVNGTGGPRYRGPSQQPMGPEHDGKTRTGRRDLNSTHFMGLSPPHRRTTRAQSIARFDQVIGVSDEDRTLAFANIEKAAKYYDVDLSETSWHELGVHPSPQRGSRQSKGHAQAA